MVSPLSTAIRKKQFDFFYGCIKTIYLLSANSVPKISRMDIYLIVGGRIRQAKARIVGRLAEVQTPHGIIEFGRWYESRDQAQAELSRRKSKTAGGSKCVTA